MPVAKFGKVSEEVKAQVVAFVLEMLEKEGVEVRMLKAIKNTTKPGDEVESFVYGRGLRCTIEVPCNSGEYYIEK